MVLYIRSLLLALLALMLAAQSTAVAAEAALPRRQPIPSPHAIPRQLATLPRSDPLQFNADGHLLAFQSHRVYVAALDHALSVEFLGANDVTPQPSTSPDDVSTGPGALPLRKVEYPNLWNGITAVYDAVEGGVAKSAFLLAPHADVADIQLRYSVPVILQTDGSLQFRLAYGNGTLTESAPVAWQTIAGVRVPVTVVFTLIAQDTVGFAVGEYDRRYPVTIDPIYQWHTFYGSVDFDYATDIAVDSSGAVYVSGVSFGTWQGQGGVSPIHPSVNNGVRDIVVLKLSSNGTYQWHTFYGSSSLDEAYGIAVDASGNVYVTGYSDQSWQGDGNANPLHPYTPGLPYTLNPDLFVLKLSTNGIYQWHTFYGSSREDWGSSIAVDGSQNVYITGDSTVTWQSGGGANPLHAHSGFDDVLVLKLNSSGAYQWHTFYGSPGFDNGNGITVAGSGNVYVVGQSDSTWQGDAGANPLHASNWLDLFVLKLNTNGMYQWHTFYGSSDGPNNENDDGANGIAVDGSENVYVAGYSLEAWQGDEGANPIHPYSGEYDLFVLKLNKDGAYQWHTFYGSDSRDAAAGIAVDGNENIYVTGFSRDTWQGDGGANPLHPFSIPHFTGLSIADLLVLKLNTNGAYQLHTFYGSTNPSPIAYGASTGEGVAADRNGNVIVAGGSGATWQGDSGANPMHAYSGSHDMVVLKLATGGGQLLLPLITR